MRTVLDTLQSMQNGLNASHDVSVFNVSADEMDEITDKMQYCVTNGNYRKAGNLALGLHAKLNKEGYSGDPDFVKEVYEFIDQMDIESDADNETLRIFDDLRNKLLSLFPPEDNE